MAECSLCDAGHYCGNASTTPKQHVCGGVDVYCPEGSIAPRTADTGYYTVAADVGPPGHWPTRTKEGYAREAVDALLAGVSDTLNGAIATRRTQRICEHGTYCVGGIKWPCPEGTYGATTGLSTPACSGQCAAGHRCPAGSWSPRQVRCAQGQHCAAAIANAVGNTGPCESGYYCPR
jgi:hypothetical protein